MITILSLLTITLTIIILSYNNLLSPTHLKQRYFESNISKTIIIPLERRSQVEGSIDREWRYNNTRRILQADPQVGNALEELA